MVDNACTVLEKERYCLGGYAVRKGRNDKVRLLGNCLVIRICKSNINYASEYRIDVREELSFKTSRRKVLELDFRVSRKASYKFCTYITSCTDDTYFDLTHFNHAF